MKSNYFRKALATCLTAVLSLEASFAHAGTELESAAGKKVVAPPETDPLSVITFGGKFSSDLSSGYADGLFHLWSPGDFFLFLDARGTGDSNSQYLGNYGLGGRYLFPEQEVIIGFNAFYDSIESKFGNHFDQLGLGAEILTHWVDARFNYYLPENTQFEVERTSHDRSRRNVSPVFGNQISPNVLLLQQQADSSRRRSTTRRREFAYDGWNAEVGFLIPGLDRYMETRIFAGAYGYGDAVGFKARLEARPVPGVIAGVEYWEDSKLMGGHWTGEIAVSVPFSIANLATGRNPFEGFSDSFRPRQREFRERMSDMVMRSHRDMTDTTTTTTTSSSNNQDTVTEAVLLLLEKKKKTAAPPPPPDEG